MRRIFWFCGVMGLSFLSYWAAGLIGLSLATIENSVSPVWPASGLAVVLGLYGGLPALLGIFVGSSVVNFETGALTGAGVLAGFGTALEVCAAVYLFKRLKQLEIFRHEVIGSAFRYGVVAFFPTMISATVGCSALYFAESLAGTSVMYAWLTWWVGDMLGMVFVFPFIVEIVDHLKNRKEKTWGLPSLYKFVQYLAVFAVVPALTWFVFASDIGHSFLFVIFFSLLLVAVYLPYWNVYLAAAVLSILAIYWTRMGHGPFSAFTVNDSLIHLQFFLGGLWLTSMVLATLRKLQLLHRARVAFVIGWILTGAAFFSFYEGSVKRSQHLFDTRVEEAKDIIEGTMKSYVQLLEAGAAYFDGSKDISRAEWKTFVTGLKIKERYPGLRGFGVIFVVDNSKLKDFEKTQRKTSPAFKVQQYAGQPISPLSQKLVITYIEPLEKNLAAVGLDVASEEHRREAALEAAGRGEPILSEEVLLLQDPGEGRGFLLFMPIYRYPSGQRILHGFVFAPIVADDFFKAVTAPFRRELIVSPVAFAEPNVKRYERDGIYMPVRLASRSVPLFWKQGPEFQEQSYMAASLAGFCGTFFTLVLGAFIASMESLQRDTAKTLEKRTVEIQDRERLWRTLTEVSPHGVFLLNTDLEVTYVNQRTQQITGLDPARFRAGELMSQVDEEDRAEVERLWNEFVSHRIDFISNYRLLVDDDVRYINSHVVPIKGDDGSALGYLGTLQDTTELHLNQAALAAAARLSSLGQMAGGIAHEINNPLAVISGRMEVMKSYIAKNNFDTTKLLGDLEKNQKTVSRIARIITALRSVAREPSREDLISFSVAQCLGETLELCEKKFQIQGVDLRVNTLPEDAWAWGRPEQVGQVLLNMLSNALDAVSDLEERWVEVDVSRKESEIVICVKDSGKGIPSKVAEHIFNPFYTTKQVGEGMGLGLSISKGIAERQGGTLIYDPQSANTLFKLILKRAPKA